MSDARVVILDGTPPDDGSLVPILTILTEVFGRGGAETRVLAVREMRIAHCIGCFGCWVETPGICVENDEGRAIARAVARSEVTVLFTPVSFGGYSSDLKRALDHFLPLIIPYFRTHRGEIHHPPRYATPRLVAVGVQRRADEGEAALFRTLVGRNALNFSPPSHAAEVVVASDDPGALRRRFEALLTRVDELPVGAAYTSLMPAPGVPAAAPTAAPGGARRALAIVGSPKTKSASTSGVLAAHLLERLAQRGWETESLTLKASVRNEGGQAELLTSVGRADLLLLVFPLYVDALPFLVTKALEVIAAHRLETASPRPQRLMAVVNCGFPEPHQNTAALAICSRFAAQSGIEWAGCLALGAGEIVSGGHPLAGPGRAGLPPAGHLVQALDLAAAALAEGRTVPSEAVELAAKCPIPLMPFALWRRVFPRFGAAFWHRRAAANGVARERLRDRPLVAVD